MYIWALKEEQEYMEKFSVRALYFDGAAVFTSCSAVKNNFISSLFKKFCWNRPTEGGTSINTPPQKTGQPVVWEEPERRHSSHEREFLEGGRDRSRAAVGRFTLHSVRERWSAWLSPGAQGSGAPVWESRGSEFMVTLPCCNAAPYAAVQFVLVLARKTWQGKR